ncbi:hypothetical protein SEPCBS119000_002902 [Sporothrix epigloea]|uniref:DNA-binding protein RAP1 n=1 Tax=Sporothrix epigloea TaxID=1892477 RepID=A0ABP0DMW2_9PEZI
MAFSFEGIKFWVSIHTPNRTKADITNNGGNLVASEADADVCIMDPLRAGSNPPRKMVSPAWISECISRQAKIDEEPFRVINIVAQNVQRQPQEAPSSQERRHRSPTTRSPPPRSPAPRRRPPAGSYRRVRNEYTAKDDEILVEWMIRKAAKAAKDGEYLSARGTKVFKELEAKHPHHTFHSWRSRWLTRLSQTTDLPYPSKLRSQPTVHSVRADRLRMATGVPGTDQSIEPEQAESQAITADDEAGLSGAPDELFFMDYNDFYIIKSAYSEWRKQIERTAQEWRRIYYKLRALYTNAPSSDDARAAAAPQNGSATVHPQAPNRFTDDEDEEDEYEEGGDDGLNIDVDAILDNVESFDDKKRHFLSCLEAYNDFLQVYVPPSFFIGGRYLETYTLWTAVEAESSGERDKGRWGRVASALGFESAKYPALESQLEAWYNQNLKELGAFLAEFQSEDAGIDDGVSQGEGSQEEEGEEEEVEEDDGDGMEDDNAVIAGDDDDDEEEDDPGEDQNAPEDVSPSKTARPTDRSTGLISSARKMLSATFLGGSKSAATEAEAAKTPSRRVRFPGRASAETDENDGDNDSPAFETRLRMARRPAQGRPSASGNVITDPETQDFAFDPETQQHETVFDELEEDEAAAEQALREERAFAPSQQPLVTASPSLTAPVTPRRKRPAETPSRGRDSAKRIIRT